MLFSVGDGHAAQGNGEVDITALETSLHGTLQFFVRKDMKLTWPRIETKTHWIQVGFDESLDAAMTNAVRETVDFLATKGLSREEAYRIVQRNAMATWSRLGTTDGRDFLFNLRADPDLAGRVPEALLDAAFDLGLHLKELDAVFMRVFGEPGPPRAAG